MLTKFCAIDSTELEPKADPSKSDCLLNWNQLPTKGFPIIFEGVVGKVIMFKHLCSKFWCKSVVTI